MGDKDHQSVITLEGAGEKTTRYVQRASNDQSEILFLSYRGCRGASVELELKLADHNLSSKKEKEKREILQQELTYSVYWVKY